MPVIKETTVHDMKTHFSRYMAELLDGTYDEVIVRNRSVPTLRVTPYSKVQTQGLDFGVSKRLGHVVVADDWDMNEDDSEIASMFDEALQ